MAQQTSAEEKPQAVAEFASSRMYLYFMSSGRIGAIAQPPVDCTPLSPQPALEWSGIRPAHAPADDSLQFKVLQRYGTGRFLVGVWAMAGPLKHYVYQRTSYDSGAN
jgi:hypothetical protein